MNVSPTTLSGLKVHNSTHYNTLDIVALLNAVEKETARRLRLGQVPLGDFAVNGQISFRDYMGSRETERVYKKGSIEDEQIYCLPGHGANRGVVRLRRASKMFPNAVEQLVWENLPERSAPVQFRKALVDAVVGAYNVKASVMDKVLAEIDFSLYPIRVLKNRAAPAARGKGNAKQRKTAKSALNSVNYQLGDFCRSLSRMIARFGPESEPNEHAAVIAVRGSFPEYDKLHSLLTQLRQVAEEAGQAANTIIAPEFTVQEEA